jgi:NAD(P)-dependent dehydrogenase (short-subunit alcohol dehydrogenase family)
VQVGQSARYGIIQCSISKVTPGLASFAAESSIVGGMARSVSTLTGPTAPPSVDPPPLDDATRRSQALVRDDNALAEGSDMAGRLEGKIALITGGGSGIGRACAVRFAREGASVCAADLDQAGAAETARQVEAAGRKALALRVDTTDEAANDAMVRRCVETFGAVDVLVAAAGVGGARVPGSSQPYTVLDIPMDRFRRVIDVNLYGVLFSNRAVARWMVENRRTGSIVNLGSIMSRMPSPSAAYGVSKAGVWMLTKCLAQELAAHGIRVNAIGPGFIETPMTAALREDASRSRWAMSVTPMGRYGRPEEVAATALFLASDDASYFTGELLHPSGGVFVA